MSNGPGSGPARPGLAQAQQHLGMGWAQGGDLSGLASPASPNPIQTREELGPKAHSSTLVGKSWPNRPLGPAFILNLLESPIL